MPDTSPNLALPYLLPAQAQKNPVWGIDVGVGDGLPAPRAPVFMRGGGMLQGR